MIKKQIQEHYQLNVIKISRILAGVGGQTYLVETESGKYILKGISFNDSYVRNEPFVAKFLKERGILTAEYIKDVEDQYTWQDHDILYHLQMFVEGKTIPFNEASDLFMSESAQTLGKIHSALSDFKRLPIGMGESFLKFMMSDHPKSSYLRTMEKAKSLNDNDILADVDYRLSQISRLKDISFDLSKFTCCNTHGDYKISQIICKDNCIAAIIDWSCACVHPVCWEIIRSFTYADPYCKNGEINIDRLIGYVKTYLQYYPLNEYDLKMMPYFFYYQILACDYYGQYYDSSDANKEDFLYQAKIATGLIKWFESNIEYLSKRLIAV